ncbi:MAG: peptide-binding protein [Acetobacteraceae bacterium]|nr:MAG: peptide-binding protein [Acetobacteraceae bacterium]
MIRLAVFLISLVALPLSAQVYPALHDVTGVAADDVLNIRSAPDAGATIIGTLPPDATGIEVVAVSGNWAVVNTDDGAGYAAIRYLSRAAGPDWNSLESPITCLGTEPFWSLKIDPQAGETRFQTPEDEAAQVAPLVASWPALPWSQTAAVGLPGGLAVLAPAECSDGMSDRRYGIAADLFLSVPDQGRLSGCCRLGAP